MIGSLLPPTQRNGFKFLWEFGPCLIKSTVAAIQPLSSFVLLTPITLISFDTPSAPSLHLARNPEIEDSCVF